MIKLTRKALFIKWDEKIVGLRMINNHSYINQKPDYVITLRFAGFKLLFKNLSTIFNSYRFFNKIKDFFKFEKVLCLQA